MHADDDHAGYRAEEYTRERSVDRVSNHRRQTANCERNQKAADVYQRQQNKIFRSGPLTVLEWTEKSVQNPTA